jgi:cytochrome c oxidase subunit 4
MRGIGGAVQSGRLYVIVWAALIALTGLTVLVASLARIGSAVVVALAIAAVKSSLVFLYFMHLRWEKRLLIKILIPIALAVLAIFIGLTYTDVLHR